MMIKVNEDLRLEIFKSNLTYKEIADEMKISREWLSRVMARKLTPDMRRKINIAIDTLMVCKHGYDLKTPEGENEEIIRLKEENEELQNIVLEMGNAIKRLNRIFEKGMQKKGAS